MNCLQRAYHNQVFLYRVRKRSQATDYAKCDTVTAQMVSAYIISRLDYCNALLVGLPRATTDPLQRVQNAAARLVLNLRLRDHVTPALKLLHWLPVASRIKFKLCLFMHLIHLGRAPQYLVDCVQLVNTSSIRHQRSSDTTDYLEHTTRTKFGERDFSYSGPAAWIRIPFHHIFVQLLTLMPLT